MKGNAKRSCETLQRLLQAPPQTPSPEPHLIFPDDDASPDPSASPPDPMNPSPPRTRPSPTASR
ncbi:hypothetical protein Bca52824_056516 [Brassica carinata]|uniref:Uncharacterized protein n=1 Tax=Brassica carinata TaxID=52824 RepID=A0A8X7UDW6_BRACI|nr:hypothetical protein Bca52824_056516 [Brassica carinata]